MRAHREGSEKSRNFNSGCKPNSAGTTCHVDHAAAETAPRGKRLLMSSHASMPHFKFLGFQLQWACSRGGKFRPRVRPRADRVQNTLKRARKFLRAHRNHPNHRLILKQVSLVYGGWLRYFAVSDCQKYLWSFRREIRIMLHRWFNRRGKRGCMNWLKLDKILEANNLTKIPNLKSLWSGKQPEWRQSSGA